jgi:hypothetical protein
MIGDSSIRKRWNEPSGIGSDRMAGLLRRFPAPSIGAPASSRVSASWFNRKTLESPRAVAGELAPAIEGSVMISQIASPAVAAAALSF